MDEHAGRRVRIIGEPIWKGRSEDEYPACVQHEAMINVAFTGREAAILCPYDTSRLEPHMVKDSYATHPIMVDTNGKSASDGYDPYGITDAYNVPLSEPPFGATTLRFEVGDLVKVRRAVAEVGLEADLPPDRIGDLQSAVNELATNSTMHAGGCGTLRTWYDEERVVCEVRDFGNLTDVMAGRLRPADGGGGHGLVMVHFLADLVQRHTSQTGTTTRVHVAAIPGRRFAGRHRSWQAGRVARPLLLIDSASLISARSSGYPRRPPSPRTAPPSTRCAGFLDMLSTLSAAGARPPRLRARRELAPGVAGRAAAVVQVAPAHPGRR